MTKDKAHENGLGLFALAVLALVAFAANSILCRLALASGSIDPATFTATRLLAGALVLAALVSAKRKLPHAEGDWLSGAMLFLYAIAFSFAYVGLSAGTGALILFGTVQASMIVGSLIQGKRPGVLQWLGLAIAVCGLVILVAPGLSAPPIDRSLLMALAGVAWGVYSLRGKGAANAVDATAGNFLRAAPLGLLVALAMLPNLHAQPSGVLWAVVSGAVTSGLGYVAWYAALPGLGPVRAAVVQLSVPILAAVGGVVLLGEVLTPRLAIAAAITLVGVGIASFRRP